jgi:hypothetical protein
MEFDESIAKLGAKLDGWVDGNLAAFASHDRVAQGKALFAGIAIAKELDRLKVDGSAAIAALLKRQDPVTDDEHVASLVRGFEFAAKLKASLHDELLDTDGSNKIVLLMNEIANALDALGPGRNALGVLLEDADARVRASAGAYLLIANLMPDRVVPILREIDRKNDASSASFTAHWALLDWELKQKARGERSG